MTAKEMFEKIGYELTEDSNKYLRYVKYDDKHAEYKTAGDYIDFDKFNQRFRLTRKTCQNNTHVKYGDIQELQAINKQIEELGWNE